MLITRPASLFFRANIYLSIDAFVYISLEQRRVWLNFINFLTIACISFRLPTASASSAASNTIATCQESKNNQMHSKYPTTKYTSFSITKQAKSDW